MFQFFKIKNVVKVMAFVGALFLISTALHETFSSYIEEYPTDYEAVYLLDNSDEVYEVNYEEVQNHVVDAEYPEEEAEYLVEPDYIEYSETEEDMDEEFESVEEVEFTDLEDNLIVAEEAEVIEFTPIYDDGEEYDGDLDGDDDDDYDHDTYEGEEECPPCPPCDEEEDECPPCPTDENCPPKDECLEDEECPPCPVDEECPPSGGKPAPPAGASPPMLPQTGVAAGLTGLTILGGTGLVATGLALAKKKNGVKLSVNEVLDQEYTEMFEN